MLLPSLPSIISLSSVTGIECYALIDTCGGSVPCLDKIARRFHVTRIFNVRAGSGTSQRFALSVLRKGRRLKNTEVYLRILGCCRSSSSGAEMPERT